MSIQFTDGFYETEDKDEIRLLHREVVVTIADTKDDLNERAAELGIEGRSKMNKEELGAHVVEEVVEE